MADLKLAVQTAFYQALNVAAVLNALEAAGLPDGAEGVFQHAPDETEPPVVLIGEITLSPAGGKGGGLDLAEVEILTLVRKPGREFLTPVTTAVREQIEDQALPPQPGVALSAPVFEGDDDELLDDGQTYFGTQRFSLFAQPE